MKLTISLDLDDDAVAVVALEYTPGEPETGPTYDCGGTPEVPAGFEIDSIVVHNSGERYSVYPVDLTNTLLQLGFEEEYRDLIMEAIEEQLCAR